MVTTGALTVTQQQEGHQQQQLSCAMQAARLSMSGFHEWQQLQVLLSCMLVLIWCSI